MEGLPELTGEQAWMAASEIQPIWHHIQQYKTNILTTFSDHLLMPSVYNAVHKRKMTAFRTRGRPT